MAGKTYDKGVPEASADVASTAQPSGVEEELLRKKSRAKPLPKPVPREEVAAMRAVIKTTTSTGLRNRCMFDMWYRAGLRISEVCNLEPRDVDIAEGTIHVVRGKGDKDRTVYFDTAVLSPLLEAWKRERKRLGLAGSPWLFCTIKRSETKLGGVKLPGRRVSERQLQGWIKRIAKQAGVDPRKVTPHKFRHSWATETYEETKDIVVVKEQLGHENLETTMIYTKLVDGARKSAIQRRRDPFAAKPRVQKQ